MGKYLRKAKTTGNVAVMELPSSQTSSFSGVRTRAKILALQRLLQNSPPNAAPSAAAASSSSESYLQLRSRRLLKLPPQPKKVVVSDSSKRNKHGSNPKTNPNPSKNFSSSNWNSRHKNEDSDAKKEIEEQEGNKMVECQESNCNLNNSNRNNEDGNNNNSNKDDIEASFGENVLDFEGRERSTRESTPCSLVRDPDAIRTPGSTTRPTSSEETNRRIQSSRRRQFPTACEMDEFFACAEKEQQREFIEKYNFDPVNEKPLPGRYEWEKIDPEKP